VWRPPFGWSTDGSAQRASPSAPPFPITYGLSSRSLHATPALQSKNDCNEAERLCREALESNEAVLGPNHPDTVSSVKKLASTLYEKRNYGPAEALYRRALRTTEASLGADHPDTATMMNDLAATLFARGMTPGAEKWCRRALAIREAALGPDHLDTAESLNNLAALRASCNDYMGAASL
jgi:tetratricopeptide (TPR) repeat protein